MTAPKMLRCFPARSALRSACNGRGDDEHGWEPKGPAQLDEAKAAVDGDGKITAWDFVDYGQPWTASSSTLLLASRQIGLTPTNPGGNNGTQSSGEIYSVANHRIVCNLINWHFPEPIPLRTGNLRAPGDTRTLLRQRIVDRRDRRRPKSRSCGIPA